MRNKFFLLICLLFAFNIANSQTYYHVSSIGDEFFINWNNSNLITSDNDWSNVPYMRGFRGDGLTTTPDVDPRTVTADGTTTPVVMLANQSDPNTLNADGFAEFESLADPCIAVRTSNTASAPFLMFYINTQGPADGFSPRITFLLRDIDGTSNNAVQQVSLQYRVGESGPFIPASEFFYPATPTDFFSGYHPDITQGPFLEGHKGWCEFGFPQACQNQPKVQVRIIFTNATGGNEWIGIDDIHIGGIQLLPIKYRSFSGVAQNGSVLLKWNAASETIQDRFEIERSADGNAFNKIGNHASKGIGEFDYSFTDISPIKGNSFYRLKMISQDNSFNYTNVVKVKWDSKDVFISAVYPTIATSKINLLVAADKIYTASLQIENISGALIKKRSINLIAGSNNIPVDINDLPVGNYFIRLYVNGDSFTERFIKQ